jgi:DNA-binding transcriptional MerR regulator
MKASDVAKQFNISTDTLRYWEGAGMIPAVPRDANGYRDYSQDEIDWIDFITCMRSSGVGISYLVKYYQLFKQGDSTKDERQALLKNQLDEMGERIKEMQNAYSRLEEKLTHYDEHVEGVLTKKEGKI